MTVRPAIFMRIETDPVIRVWSGPKPYPLAADDVDLEGGTYLPLGLSSFPILDRMLDDQAGEYDFSLSVEPETLQLLNIPADIEGARVNMGQRKFDARWQPLDAVDWTADFDAESVSWSDVQDGPDGRSASVSLKVGTASTDRRLAPQLFWSPVEQAILSPTDQFFAFVPGYATGTERQWPA